MAAIPSMALNTTTPGASPTERAAIGDAARTDTPRCKAIARFAVAYGDQNERDYAVLEAAVADGRLKIEREPA